MKLHIPKDPVMLVDDEPEILSTYKEIFSMLGIPAESFENGKKAIKAFQEKAYSLVLTDLDMPEMNGISLIRKIRETKPETLILVSSGMNEPDTIIEVMKEGVFDYVLKPFEVDQLQAVLKKALGHKYLKEQEYLQSLYASEKLKAQIEWLNYKESSRIKDKKDSALKNLEDMKNSFLEGASIGSIMTMIFMMKDMMEEKPEGYLVNKELMNTLIECNEVCRHQFEGIFNITSLLESQLELKSITCEELNTKIPEWTEHLLPHFVPKKVHLTYPSMHSKKKIKINLDSFQEIIEELIINAYKYCLPGSTINVFSFISEGYFILTVKNDVSEEPYGGIPKEFEQILTEPFIRIHPNDEKIIKVEKFGLGLGLTVVDNVIKKHNGMFFIHDINDYTSNKKKLCVAAEVFIPIEKEN
jgi:YesN/AraC family two-component response regulator